MNAAEHIWALRVCAYRYTVCNGTGEAFRLPRSRHRPGWVHFCKRSLTLACFTFFLPERRDAGLYGIQLTPQEARLCLEA